MKLKICELGFGTSADQPDEMCIFLKHLCSLLFVFI
jgi:hypothetical protein